MGLDYSKADLQPASPEGLMNQTINAQAAVLQEPAPVREYDIEADRKKMNEELTGSEEVDALLDQIEIGNMETIVRFGAGAAGEIAKSSDIILHSMNVSQLDDSGEILRALAQIMSRFNIDEIREDSSFFGRLFGNKHKQMDKILDKYHTMGDEVDRIYVQLRSYEDELRKSGRMLERLFEANVNYYHELVKYILAGEQGCRELEDHIALKKQELQAGGDPSIQFELVTVQNALNLLRQRTQDLKTAELVALQSIPMIRMMQFNQYNLIMKINSAFIVTLPVFKGALAQAILLKRQRIQAQALAQLDKKTGEMLARNARSAAQMARNTALPGAGDPLRIETLRKTFKTITDGIGETQRLQEDARRKRADAGEALQKVKENYMHTIKG